MKYKKKKKTNFIRNKRKNNPKARNTTKAINMLNETTATTITI